MPKIIQAIVLAGCALTPHWVDASAKGDSKTSLLIESRPTPETRARVIQLLQNSTRITIYFTPKSAMGRVGFSDDLAKRTDKYVLEYRCHGTCDLELKELARRLSHGRRIRGECPRPISTIMHFWSNRDEKIESLVFSANGQCFVIGSTAYFVEKRESIVDLVDDLTKVLVQ